MCSEEFDTLQRLKPEILRCWLSEIMDERPAAYKAGNTTKLPKN